MDPVGAENPAPPEEEEDDDEAESAEAGEKHIDSQVNYFFFFRLDLVLFTVRVLFSILLNYFLTKKNF